MVVAGATIIFEILYSDTRDSAGEISRTNANRKSQTRIDCYVLSSTTVVKEKIASADNACDAHHNAPVLRTLASSIIPS